MALTRGDGSRESPVELTPSPPGLFFYRWSTMLRVPTDPGVSAHFCATPKVAGSSPVAPASISTCTLKCLTLSCRAAIQLLTLMRFNFCEKSVLSSDSSCTTWPALAQRCIVSSNGLLATNHSLLVR
jgi:hypothetical protein